MHLKYLHKLAVSNFYTRNTKTNTNFKYCLSKPKILVNNYFLKPYLKNIFDIFLYRLENIVYTARHYA